ncbi:MAG: hypothetical protein ACK4IY_10450 [Chitinophagales bacterium]
MKPLIILLISTLLSLLNANAGSEPDCANSVYRDELKQYLQNCKPFFDVDLSGVLQIVFKVNADNSMEIIYLSSSNIFLESHAYCALQGAKISGQCMDSTKEYSVQVQFLDSKFQ